MGFGDAVSSVLRQYAAFNGRACRSEFWWFALFYVLADIVVRGIDMAAGTYFLAPIAALALFLPNLAVSVRRLHDIDRSGWWIFISLLPLVGWIILLVWYLRRGDPGANRFGGDPLGMGRFAPA